MTAFPPLVPGDKGPAVEALQRALYPLIKSLGGVPTNARNGQYGVKTIRDVQVVQRVHRILVYTQRYPTGLATGKTGRKTWEVVAPHLDDRGRYLLEKHDQEQKETVEDRKRAALVAWARWYVETGGKYIQRRPMRLGKSLPITGDCSESVTNIYFLAGCPDPNGNKYNGSGWTGTLRARGQSIPLSAAKPGDLLHYDGPQHVAMLLDDGSIFTFGSTPPRYDRPNYRRIVLVTRHPLT